MSWLWIVVLVLLILVVGGVLFYRLLQTSGVALPWARRAPPPATPSRVTLLQGDEELPVEEDPPPPAPRRGLPEGWLSRFVGWPLAIVLGIPLGLLLLWSLPRLILSGSDQFVVLIAPFRENGSPGPSGQQAATQLVAALAQLNDQQLVARVLPNAPADENAAIELLRREGADVLIWGDMAPGSLLDTESLQPLIFYQPTGAFAPNGLDGYSGRFVVPPVYRLAQTPINGAVVLPRLVGALADYGNGRFDQAFTELGALITNYPALTPALPRSILGNIYWARGEYRAATEEYSRILSPNAPAGTSDNALLANNLGAILQDAGDARARDAFNEAIRLLNGRDLGELRLNLGLEELRFEHPNEALLQLEQARRLLDPAPQAVHLALARANRALGPERFAQAQRALDEAGQRAGLDAEAVVGSLRTPAADRGRAAVLAERGLLGLARLFKARGRLRWELQLQTGLKDADLQGPLNDLTQAAAQTERLANEWQRRAIAEQAGRATIDGLVADGQARRLAAQQRERQEWADAVTVALGELRAQGPQNVVGGLWSALFGDRSALGQARQRLDQIVARNPTDIESSILLGHAYLALRRPDDANRAFAGAAFAAPNRPEPPYGQALAALNRTPPDLDTGRSQLEAAIQRDSTFFPARERLAQLAERTNDWATVVTQRQVLAQQEPSTENQLALGRALWRTGASNATAASQVLQPLAEGGNVPALLELAQIYRETGDLPRAASALERAQDIDPQNPQVALARAELLVLTEQPGPAEEQYRLAIFRDSALVRARLGLAELYASDERKELAEREYRAALETGTNDPDVLKQIGAALLEADTELPAALSAYERAVRADPNDPEAQHGLAQAYLRNGRLEQARTAEQLALDLRGGNFPEALVGLGDVALGQGQLAAATDYYNRAIQQNPQLTIAYIGLGRVAGAQNNWAVALSRFQSAATANPRSPEAQLWLGEALVRQGQAREALTPYAQALKLKPRYPEARFGQGQAWYALGDLDRAVAEINAAINLRQRYAEAHLLLGQINEQRGELRQALRSYDQAVTSNGDLAEAYYRRALLLLRLDRIGEARGDFERAVARNNSFAEGHFWLGRTYLVEGRAADALRSFQTAIDLRGGNYPEAVYYRGVAEEQSGRLTEAIQSYRQALTLDSRGTWASEAQAALARLGAQ